MCHRKGHKHYINVLRKATKSTSTSQLHTECLQVRTVGRKAVKPSVQFRCTSREITSNKQRRQQRLQSKQVKQKKFARGICILFPDIGNISRDKPYTFLLNPSGVFCSGSLATSPSCGRIQEVLKGISSGYSALTGSSAVIKEKNPDGRRKQEARSKT